MGSFIIAGYYWDYEIMMMMSRGHEESMGSTTGFIGKIVGKIALGDT
jgi:hypothetical protein